MVLSEKFTYTQEDFNSYEGKFGRLNQISKLSKEEQLQAMIQYKREEAVAKELFKVY